VAGGMPSICATAPMLYTGRLLTAGSSRAVASAQAGHLRQEPEPLQNVTPSVPHPTKFFTSLLDYRMKLLDTSASVPQELRRLAI
jgi:hypothetical protein